MSNTKSYRILAIIIIAVGVYALAVELNLITWDFIGDLFDNFGRIVGNFFGAINWDLLWPLVLVALGVGLLLRRSEQTKAKRIAE